MNQKCIHISRRRVFRTSKRTQRMRYLQGFAGDLSFSSSPQGIVAGLLASISIAEKVAKAAKRCGLVSRNSDKSKPLIDLLISDARIVLILIDWDACEAEAYKLLDDLRGRSDQKYPVAGFVSLSKSALVSEAQRAGCDRVYIKTEFLTDLDSIIARYAA